MAKREAKRKRKGEKSPQFAPQFGKLFDVANTLQISGISVDVDYLVTDLVNNGSIIDGECLLRYKRSFKRSWDCGMRATICFDRLSCSFFTNPRVRERIQQYLDFAKETQYFDADLKARPKGMPEGFYLLYPVHPRHLNQNNPIIAKEPNLLNYAANLEKLATAAVLLHNELTGSGLTFHKVVKSNLFVASGFQVYFITLEACDNGCLVICKSRVSCDVNRQDDFPNFHGQSCIRNVCVESFQVTS